MEVYILDALDDSIDYPNGCSEDKTSFERIHRELADIHLHHGAESHDVAARITAPKFFTSLRGKTERVWVLLLDVEVRRLVENLLAG
jgi:hypothetical protein